MKSFRESECATEDSELTLTNSSNWWDVNENRLNDDIKEREAKKEEKNE